MKRTILTILPAFAIAAVAPVGQERRYSVGRFAAVEVAGRDDVTIRPGAVASVSASGSPDALRDARVEVRDGTLFIARSGAGTSRALRFDVVVPELRAVRARGAGIVAVADAKGFSFTGEMTGTGQLVIAGTDRNDATVISREGRTVRTTLHSETRASANGTGLVTVTAGARCTVLDGAPIRVACH